MKLGRKKSKLEKLFSKPIVRKRIVPREFLEEYEINKIENIQKLSSNTDIQQNYYFVSVNGHEVFEALPK